MKRVGVLVLGTRTRYTVAVIIPFAMLLLSYLFIIPGLNRVYDTPAEVDESMLTQLEWLLALLALAIVGAVLAGSIPRRWGGRIAITVLYFFAALFVNLVFLFGLGPQWP